MVEEQPGLNDDPPEDETDPEEENEPGTGEDEEEEEPADKSEAAKWKKRAERRDAKLREAQAELAKLKAKAEGGEEPDKEQLANAKLISAEARTQLAAVGITDRDDQKKIIAMLNLGDVDVDDDGEVDSETIEELITDLRRIFGGGKAGPVKRTPRVDTRDKGTKTEKADPDAARFRRILTGQ